MNKNLKKALIIFGSFVATGAVVYVSNKQIKKAKAKRLKAFTDFQVKLKESHEPGSTGMAKEELKLDESKISPSGLTINSEEAKKFAQRIWDAEGWINDDEQAVYDVIDSLKSEADYHLVAKEYEKLSDNDSGISMFHDLQSWMSKEELGIVNNLKRKLK